MNTLQHKVSTIMNSGGSRMRERRRLELQHAKCTAKILLINYS